jgi:hypothetical protein
MQIVQEDHIDEAAGGGEVLFFKMVQDKGC